MAFTGQVFSVGQVLTAAQMNQQDENIDEVRRDHKGTTAPPELTAGVTWLDDSNPEWMLKQFDGVDQIAKGWFDTSQNQFTASVMGQFKNKLINGDFGLAQRGNSFQVSSSQYTLDRWRQFPGTSGLSTITQQSFTLGQTEVPNEPEFFFRHVQNSGGSSTPQDIQRIEGVRTFAGQQITLSFYARSNSGTLTVTPRFTQNFGTGGSPSASVTHEVNSVSVTGSFQQFTQTFSLSSISGKTIGTADNDYLELLFVEPTDVTFSLDLAQVQIERGPIATPFELRHIEQEQALAQRYFWKSFNFNVIPGSDDSGSPRVRARGTEGNNSIFFHWTYPSAMRTSPTITIYAPASGVTGAVRNLAAGTNLSAVVSRANDRNAQVTNVEATINGDLYAANITADAEL